MMYALLKDGTSSVEGTELGLRHVDFNYPLVTTSQRGIMSSSAPGNLQCPALQWRGGVCDSHRSCCPRCVSCLCLAHCGYPTHTLPVSVQLPAWERVPFLVCPRGAGMRSPRMAQILHLHLYPCCTQARMPPSHGHGTLCRSPAGCAEFPSCHVGSYLG